MTADLTAAEKVAQAMARLRVPPSTVYMDGSHNPNMREQRAARRLCEDMGVDPDGPADPVAAAVKAETERCAALVDDYEDSLRPEYPDAARLARHIAAAIRDAKAGDDG